MQEISISKHDGTTKTVISHYTDEQVIERLWHHTGYDFGAYRDTVMVDFNGDLTSKFARDLANKAAHRDLSPKQIAWVHIIVAEHEAPKKAPVASEQMPRLRAMMDQAAKALKFPKIHLAAGEQPIRLAVAGERSKAPGTIHITDGGPYGQNTYFGRISLEGGLFPSQAMTPEVLEALRRMDQDPEACATAHGHATGSCCFCNRELTDSRSVAMGYGPTCADNWGLAWGDETAQQTIEVSADKEDLAW